MITSQKILVSLKPILELLMRDAPVALSPLLQVTGLEAWYGESQVLHGMEFSIREGQVISLLGRNGAGKSTTLKAVMGLHEARRGVVTMRGTDTIRLESDAIARLGIAYCPEDRGIFSSLSVEENLMLPPVLAPGGMSVQDIHALFPNLKERARSQGTKLSGGEQQMLAIGRILRTGAKLLLLDEPTEGIAPVIIQHMARALHRLKELGYTIVLVEQNFHFAADVADAHLIVEQGHVVDHFTRSEVRVNLGKLQQYLGV